MTHKRFRGDEEMTFIDPNGQRITLDDRQVKLLREAM